MMEQNHRYGKAEIPDSSHAKYQKRCIAYIGAGGKTSSLLYDLAHSKSSVRTMGVTTTKMQLFSQQREQLLDVRADFSCGRASLFGHSDGSHLLPPTDEEWRWIQEKAQCILVEADGSKRLPMKVPLLEREPVLPPGCTEVRLYFGASALDKKIETHCFRSERALALVERHVPSCWQGKSTRMSESVIAALLWFGYLHETRLQEEVDLSHWVIIANQVDTPLLKKRVEQIFHHLSQYAQRDLAMREQSIPRLWRVER